MNWHSDEIEGLVRRALAEDVGTGDATTTAIVPQGAPAKAKILARQTLVCAGLPLAESVFRALDREMRIGYLHNVKVARREILRPRSDPFGPDGGIAVLRGTLAPGGAVIKVFSVPKEMHVHVGPARVFDCEEGALDALRDRQVMAHRTG